MFETEILKECPFCRAGETIIHENKGAWGGTKGYGEPISVEVRHWCEKREGQPASRMLAFVGRDRDSSIAAWNTRAELPAPETLDKPGTIEALKAIQWEFMRAAEPYQMRLAAFHAAEPPSPIQGPDGQLYVYTGPLPPAPDVKCNKCSRVGYHDDGCLNDPGGDHT